MLYCRDCGGQMHETAVACPHCGSSSSVTPMSEASAGSGGLGGWLSLNGRISRKTYWLQYILPLAIGVSILQAIFEAAGLPLVSLALGLLSMVASLAGGVKRCHDRNRSGWFQLWALLPIIGWIWVFVELYCLRGTLGSNRFGADPLAPTNAVRAYAAA